MNPIDAKFIQHHRALFEDFWNRDRAAPPGETLALRFPAFGYAVELQTNANEVLDAARLAAPRYCQSEPLLPQLTIRLNINVVPGWDTAPVPSELPARIQTVGAQDYLFQAATPWLQWFADLKARTAYGFISPSLAAEPRLVSRYLLDRAVLNILLNEGVGQLHATSLVGDDHVLLFIAPHGTGKSTTAFHLLRADYKLMGDGLLFVRQNTAWRERTRAGAPSFELMGYPVGEAKLMPHMQPLFPEWRGDGAEVSVHNVVKRIVNLRDFAPDKLIEHSVFPERVILCLAERNGSAPDSVAEERLGTQRTRAELLTAEAAMTRVMPDTIHWDEPARMIPSLQVLRHLIERAVCYRLTLGSDRDELVNTIVGLAHNRQK